MVTMASLRHQAFISCAPIRASHLFPPSLRGPAPICSPLRTAVVPSLSRTYDDSNNMLQPRCCTEANKPYDSKRRTAVRLILTLSVGVPLLFDRSRGMAFADVGDSVLQLSDQEWKGRLTYAAYRVLRQSGTEMPFSSPLNAEKRTGVFTCAGCDNELYTSDMKYDSGTGWPSFFDAIKGGVVLHRTPSDVLFMRTEVRCAKCDGHLGHVFDDGPRPTKKRYCMNGVAMKFVEQPKKA